MMRCSLASLLPKSGFPGAAAPVAGSTRRTEPFRTRGSPAGRRWLWLRSEPPSAVGGVWLPPTGTGGSPHGFLGVGGGLPWVPPNCPQSLLLKLAPSPPLTYHIPSAPKASAPLEWPGTAWHQSSIGPCSLAVQSEPTAVSRDRWPLIMQPSVVAPGGVGQGSEVPSPGPHLGAIPPIGASCEYRT